MASHSASGSCEPSFCCASVDGTGVELGLLSRFFVNGILLHGSRQLVGGKSSINFGGLATMKVFKFVDVRWTRLQGLHTSVVWCGIFAVSPGIYRLITGSQRHQTSSYGRLFATLRLEAREHPLRRRGQRRCLTSLHPFPKTSLFVRRHCREQVELMST